VKYDDQGSDYAKINPDNETCADDYTVAKVVYAVTDEIKIGKGMHIAYALMAMAPMQVPL
jgi:hypothetical protein